MITIIIFKNRNIYLFFVFNFFLTLISVLKKKMTDYANLTDNDFSDSSKCYEDDDESDSNDDYRDNDKKKKMKIKMKIQNKISTLNNQN